MAKPKVRYAVVGLGQFRAEGDPARLRARAEDVGAVGVRLVGPEEAAQARQAATTSSIASATTGSTRSAARDAIDAVYLATPNDTHRAFIERVAPHGIHVLVEKPMAVTEEDCEAMIRVCPTTLQADDRLSPALRGGEPLGVEIVRKGQHRPAALLPLDLQLSGARAQHPHQPARQGGGPLYDIGTYCINAARYLFRDEPVEVVGLAARGDDARFDNVEEQVSAILRFPRTSWPPSPSDSAPSATGFYEVVGDKGKLRVDPAYEYQGELELELTVGDKKPRRKRWKSRDQIAPEIAYFSECILKGSSPSRRA